MNENRSPVPGSWVTTVIAAVGVNFLLLVPSLFAFQSYVSGDMGWAITVDALWDEGKLPTRDYSYFYGLLTLVIDRTVFSVLGRSPNSVAVLYFLCNVAITFGFVRFAKAAHFGRTARLLGAVTAPIVVMPVVFPSPTHGLEPALLINAIAFQATGRYSAALALVTACVFIKPSMALVYGAILTGLILFRPGQQKFLRLVPAAVVGLAIAGLLAAVFGVDPLVESLLPFAGMKVYANENYGFFFGIGRGFWLVEPFTPWHYLFTPSGFWLLATAALIPGGIRAAVRGRGPLAGTVATCAALHVVFFCFMFGNHMSWFYYSYVLVIGLCGVLDRSGLPLKGSAPTRMRALTRCVVIGFAASAQLGTVVFGLVAWSTAVRTETTAGLFANASNEESWTEIRALAKRERVFVLSPTGAAHDLMPEVQSVRLWFLIRAVTTPAEIEQVREQIRRADWVVVPYDFVSHFSRWPEFADELRDSHFVFLKEYPLYILLRRIPAN